MNRNCSATTIGSVSSAPARHAPPQHNDHEEYGEPHELHDDGGQDEMDRQDFAREHDFLDERRLLNQDRRRPGQGIRHGQPRKQAAETVKGEFSGPFRCRRGGRA